MSDTHAEQSGGYTLADLQRVREEFDIGYRLYRIEREHKMRQLLGDDVYDFMTGKDGTP